MATGREPAERGPGTARTGRETRPTAVRVARAADRKALLQVLMLSFSADPCARYSFSDTRHYVNHFPKFCLGIGGAGIQRNAAFLTEDGAAAALWLPPGMEPDKMLVEASLQDLPAVKRPVLAQVIEEMAAYHPPEPHWYLGMVGVDPSRQGQGLGSALIREGLRRCDEEGCSAFLESSNIKNLPLYERHGFELLGAIQPGDFPPLYPMLRAAR